MYYFKYNNVIIFNDLLYAEDHPYWNDDSIWESVPDFSLYLVNKYGEVIRKRDSYLIPVKKDDEGHDYVIIISDARKKEKVHIDYILDTVFDDLLDSSSEDESLEDSLSEDSINENTLDNLISEMEHTHAPVSVEKASETLEVQVQIDPRYLNEYPIIITDNDGEFMRWYPSIQNFLSRTHGTEGMDPYVIYRSCNSDAWQKCYGKMIRWDPLLYVKYDITKMQKIL